MTEVYSWCADQARVSDCVTLDVDSTAITRFGHQQGARSVITHVITVEKATIPYWPFSPNLI